MAGTAFLLALIAIVSNYIAISDMDGKSKTVYFVILVVLVLLIGIPKLV